MSKLPTWPRVAELALLLVATLAPQFLLASNVSADEWLKAGAGLGSAGVVAVIYKLWRG